MQLAELTKVFIPSKRSIRKTLNNAEPPTLPHSDKYWAELSTWYREQKDLKLDTNFSPAKSIGCEKASV